MEESSQVMQKTKTSLIVTVWPMSKCMPELWIYRQNKDININSKWHLGQMLWRIKEMHLKPKGDLSGSSQSGDGSERLGRQRKE